VLNLLRTRCKELHITPIYQLLYVSYINNASRHQPASHCINFTFTTHS